MHYQTNKAAHIRTSLQGRQQTRDLYQLDTPKERDDQFKQQFKTVNVANTGRNANGPITNLIRDPANGKISTQIFSAQYSREETTNTPGESAQQSQKPVRPQTAGNANTRGKTRYQLRGASKPTSRYEIRDRVVSARAPINFTINSSSKNIRNNLNSSSH